MVRGVLRSGVTTDEGAGRVAHALIALHKGGDDSATAARLRLDPLEAAAAAVSRHVPE
jgi:hypothetical protein